MRDRMVNVLPKSIYNKNIPASCGYCRYAHVSPSLKLVFCKFKGPVSEEDACRRYCYDPLKRTPAVSAKLPEYSSEDFAL